MLIESEFSFDAPPEVVYDGLQNPDVLANALPGSGGLEVTGEDRYEGEMDVSVGPVTAARFTVVVEVKDKVRPERFDMHVDGRGTAGFVTGIARIALEERNEGTLMKYRADLQVGGRIAGVGQRLLDSVGRAMSRQGLEAVNQSLNARLAPAEAPAGHAAETSTSLASSASLPTTGRDRNLLLLVLAVIAALLLVLAL
jgi:carbon monoxide dehydrogenase subunit G